jgi:hypothetical protein
MNLEQHQRGERPGLKIVCEECGSLSIKVVDPATAPGTTLIQCGRRNAVRGTWPICTIWRGEAPIYSNSNRGFFLASNALP